MAPEFRRPWWSPNTEDVRLVDAISIDGTGRKEGDKFHEIR